MINEVNFLMSSLVACGMYTNIYTSKRMLSNMYKQAVIYVSTVLSLDNLLMMANCFIDAQ